MRTMGSYDIDASSEKREDMVRIIRDSHSFACEAVTQLYS